MRSIYIATNHKYLDDYFFYRIKEELMIIGYEVINPNKDLLFEARISVDKIRKCDIFIAIINYADPTLFYEIGYASALNKEIIIISNNEDEIPFFLRNYRFIKSDLYQEDIGFQLSRIIGDSSLYNRYNKRNYPIPSNFEELVRVYKKNPQIIEILSEKEMEEIVYNHFRYFSNCEIERTDYNRDYGSDFVLYNYKGHRKTLVEVKKYNVNSKVSINIIQQLMGAMSLYEADYGIIITTSTFTMSAKDFAESLPYKIELWDINYVFSLFCDGEYRK